MIPDPTSPAPTPAELDHTFVQALFECIPDAVYFKDRQSRFLAVSRSKALRHGCADPADLIGKSDADLFSEAHSSRTHEDEQAIMRTGEPIVDKVEKLTWPDGRVSWARSSKFPLRDASRAIVGTFGLSEDITEAKQMEEALEKARKEVMDASRLAGMAEVATGVLHNVGNVLNSLNVSANVLAAGLRQLKTDSLSKVSSLLREHQGDLGDYLTRDPKGRLIPEFIETLSRHSGGQRDRLVTELESLQRNIEHIKEIVTMQQAYATMVGVVEPLDPSGLVEDALRMNSAALLRHEVSVLRDYQAVPPVQAERGKVLQILINLIRNAKYALDEARTADKVITLRIEPGDAGTVRFVVQDNGIGIPPENLTRIFAHGFTTRAQGHGFGLHSSALAAREMRGTLAAASDGPGTGASFTLQLPVAAAAAAARAA
jgi:PAS domain S-box-containing protein